MLVGIFLVILILASTALMAQGIQYRSNNPAATGEWFFTNNTTVVTGGFLDTAKAWLGQKRFQLTRYDSTMNDGTPNSQSGMAWMNSTGEVKRTPWASLLTAASIATALGFTPAPQVNSDWNSGSGVSQILNKPTIPTNTNQLTNGSGFLDASGVRGALSVTNIGSGSASYNNSTGVFNIPTGSTYTQGTGIGISGGVISNTSPDQVVSITQGTGVTVTGTYPSFTIAAPPIGTSNAAGYGTGTVYTLTTSSQKITFGTTSPSITIPATGTYLISSNLTLEYVGLTTLSLNACSFKLRRTNNTAADLPNTTTPFKIPVLTLVSQTGGDADLPAIIYTGTAGDVIELWGNLGATVSVGSVQISSAGIVAVRIN